MGSTTPPHTLPYWQINIPPHLRTETCPAFLSPKVLSEKDKTIISTPDSYFTTLDWPTLRTYIAQNRLDLFQRRPSDLRRYLEYIWWIRHDSPYAESKGGGGVMGFILRERLGWDISACLHGKDERERGERWTDENIKVLCNDWPYGIEEKVVHLVVWTKFELEDDPETGDLTESARGEIDGYVERVFGRVCGSANVIWFKNWKSLKSVHAVEHFHVMLYDPDPEFVRTVTNGDIPLSKKLENQANDGVSAATSESMQ